MQNKKKAKWAVEDRSNFDEMEIDDGVTTNEGAVGVVDFMSTELGTLGKASDWMAEK